MLTPEQTSLLPTDEDVAFYLAHGWYRSKQILPDAVLQEAWDGVQRHFAGERDDMLPPTSGFADWKPGDSTAVRNAEVVALQNRHVRTLAFHPILGAVASRLARRPVIRYFADTLIDKSGASPDNESVVGWHTDRAYWGTCTSEALLTMWIPFQDVTIEMGPLLYIDASHRWPETEHLRTFNCKDLGELERRFPQAVGCRRMAMTLKRGEFSVHHCRLIHGSGPNTSGRSRAALAVHLQDGDNRYRTHRNEQGVPWHIFLDDLAAKQADGSPDYADPAVFPTLWNASIAA